MWLQRIGVEENTLQLPAVQVLGICKENFFFSFIFFSISPIVSFPLLLDLHNFTLSKGLHFKTVNKLYKNTKLKRLRLLCRELKNHTKYN